MKCPLREMHLVGRPIQWYEAMSVEIDKMLKAAKNHRSIEIELDVVILKREEERRLKNGTEV